MAGGNNRYSVTWRNVKACWLVQGKPYCICPINRRPRHLKKGQPLVSIQDTKDGPKDKINKNKSKLIKSNVLTKWKEIDWKLVVTQLSANQAILYKAVKKKKNRRAGKQRWLYKSPTFHWVVGAVWGETLMHGSNGGDGMWIPNLSIPQNYANF